MELSKLAFRFRFSALAALSRKVRSQTEQVVISAASVKKKVMGEDTEGSVLFSVSGGPRIAEIDDNLNLEELKKSNLLIIRAKLQERNLSHWIFERGDSGIPIVNIPSQDYRKALESIAADPSFTSWYFRALLPNGRAISKEEFVSALANRSDVVGVRLYRYVASGEKSHFFGNAMQGVDIIRWGSDAKTDRLISEVWNPRATELPDPVSNAVSWAEHMGAANSALGYDVDFPIDAVITWVDGDDVEWKKRKSAALGNSDDDLVKNAVDVSRFESLDELRYCLRSIEQYAPWIRKIYIVTDRQRPNWLNSSVDSKVQIVDHSEIWKDSTELPVFNSHAIEANLHRIKGLSEHFLYFNDDMILTSPLSPERFFHANGISKVFYSRALVDFSPISDEDNVSTVAAKNARQILSRDGFPTYNRKFFHTPYALRVSVMNEMEERYPEIFAATSRAKFRSLSDAALAGSFYFNFALSTGRAVPGRIRYDYIDPADSIAVSRLRRITRRRDVEVVVINDGSQEVSEEKRNEIRRLVPRLLHDLLPVPSSFEM